MKYRIFILVFFKDVNKVFHCYAQGHKKLASSTSGERYRLLLSDGLRINSFTMLATQLNHMINTELTEFTIVQIDRFAMSTVNNAGKPK